MGEILAVGWIVGRHAGGETNFGPVRRRIPEQSGRVAKHDQDRVADEVAGASGSHAANIRAGQDLPRRFALFTQALYMCD